MHLLLHNLRQRIRGEQPDPPSAYLTNEQAAERMGLSSANLNTYVQRGIIQAFTIGNQTYFRKTDIDDLLSAERALPESISQSDGGDQSE